MSRTKIKPTPCKVTAYSGGFDVELPRFMVENLNSPGQKDKLARRYANALIGFREAFPHALCAELLEPYGAWYADDFERMSERQIQDTLLWVLAGNAEHSETMTPTHITCYIGD